MKTKSKILLLVAIFLISICLFATNTVQATTDEDTLKSYIPDNVTVSFLESNAFEDDVESAIKTEITTALTSNNVDLTDKTLSVSMNYDENGSIHSWYVSLSDNTTHKDIVSKNITVQYSNTSNYNDTDKTYVDNKLASMTLNKITPVEIGKTDNFDEDSVFENYIKNKMSGTGLTYYLQGTGAGCADEYLTKTYNLYIFKNDVLYSVKSIAHSCFYMVTIPDSVQDTDEAYIEYALPTLKSNWSNYTINNVEKLTGDVTNVNNTAFSNDGTFYKMLFSDGDYARAILKKADITKVIDHIAISNDEGVTLTATNIESTNSTYTEMLEKATANGYSNVFGAYELKLSSGTIDTNGLTVTFSLGTENNEKQVYILHKKADGSYEEFTKTIENGKVDITVSELSPFMVALSSASTTTTETTNTAPNNAQTSSMDIVLYSVLAIGSLLGITYIVVKGKKKVA